MKYGIWNTALPDSAAVDALQQAGYSPLTARVLAGRGCGTPQQAQELLCADAPLFDPFLLREMDRAVQTVRQALQLGQRIAVFGDYDVDGITATCLLTDFLRGMGADCVVHIPGRLEEGYGLNAGAIRQLRAQGVRLIITVDCGITALEEAELCRELGVTLVVTDHHECKEQLPQCAAVVDPHRPDRTYPHTMLSGVGIAFKLAAALSGDQDGVARRYCDLICLGTIADVMTLQGENRRLVVMGLEALRQPQRLGLRALIRACGCDEQEITAGTIGYILAPRVNAAGRMEQAELAVRLFLTQDPQEADRLAETLCRLNRERQTIESDIYSEAVSRLHGAPDGAIVLAGEHWHQGVVGIVASRLSEEFCRPTFLICLDGERGKASSRSYGGFNLFASLTELSGLPEGSGGHELAAGFTIARKNIDACRAAMCRCAAAYAASAPVEATLQVDCEIEASLLTEENVRGLDIVLGAAESDIARLYAPEVVRAGAVFVDNSSAYRMDDDVPLVIPEVNPEDVKLHHGIIASANCSTIITVTAVNALNAISPIRAMVASTYQAVSGAGAGGPVELAEEVEALRTGKPVQPKVFSHQIAYNLIPQIGGEQYEGYTSEEMKMQNEGRKIMHLPDLRVTCTCVRVPVVRSHSISVTLRFDKPVSVREARHAIAAAPGCRLVDDLGNHEYPMPLDTSDQDLVYVGRIRPDLTDDNGLTLWCCGDQIRKGAATNTIQVAELLIEK